MLTARSASLSVPFDPGPSWFLGVVLPAAAIYFLYHPVLEIALRGRTPGKRIAGLRIVTLEGNAPGIGALLVRNVFRLIDSFPGLYCVGLIATVATRQSVRLGDLAAGTVLVYEREPLLAFPGTTLASGELVAELDARWPDLSIEARGVLARDLLRRLGEPDTALCDADDAALRVLLARRSGHAAAAVGTGTA